MDKADLLNKAGDNMNEQLFDALYNASEYFRISNKYNEIISRFREDIVNCEQKYTEMKNKKNNPIVINIASIWVGLPLLLTGLVGVSNKAGFLVTSFLLAIGIIGTFIIPIWYTKRCKDSKKNKKRADEYWYKELAPIVAKNRENIERANKEWKNFSEANKGVIEFLPQPYRNYSATSYMAIAVGKGRADTFKEAANLYEEQLHRWRLEAINEQIASQNWAIQNNLATLGQQQVETNKLLRDIETLEFYNMWYK